MSDYYALPQWAIDEGLDALVDLRPQDQSGAEVEALIANEYTGDWALDGRDSGLMIGPDEVVF